MVRPRRGTDTYRVDGKRPRPERRRSSRARSSAASSSASRSAARPPPSEATRRCPAKKRRSVAANYRDPSARRASVKFLASFENPAERM